MAEDRTLGSLWWEAAQIVAVEWPMTTVVMLAGVWGVLARDGFARLLIVVMTVGLLVYVVRSGVEARWREPRRIARLWRGSLGMPGAASDLRLTSRSGAVPRLSRDGDDEHGGQVWRLALVDGLTVDDVADRADALRGFFGAEVVLVEPVDARSARLRVYDRDPLEAVETRPAGARSSVESVEVGRTLAGPLGLRLIESNCLVGGMPGWGKSGLLTALLTGAASLPNVALIGLDPKRVEQAEWSPRFSAVVTDLDQMTATLSALVDEMERRYEYLTSTGRKKITPDVLGPDLPLLVLVVDELAEVIASGVGKDEKAADTERASLLRRLIAKGRAAGVVVIAATQKPDATTVPTAVRDLFAQRIGFRTGNTAMTETIMGGLASDAPAHELRHRGVAWTVVDGRLAPERVRVWWVPDEDVARIAAASASHRVALPFLDQSPEPVSS